MVHCIRDNHVCVFSGTDITGGNDVLHDFSLTNNIQDIDTLIKHFLCMDLSILKTLKHFVNNRKIKQIQCDTETDNALTIHLNLSSTKLEDSKELLSADCGFVGEYSSAAPDDRWEMDTL